MRRRLKPSAGDGTEEDEVGCAMARNSGSTRRWSGGGDVERRGGALGEGCGCGEPRVLCPGPSPVLYSAGDRGPPAIWAGRPRSGRVQGVRPDLWIGPVEINSNTECTNTYITIVWI